MKPLTSPLLSRPNQSISSFNSGLFLLCLLLLFTSRMWSQAYTYPVFANGGQQTNLVAEGDGPSLAVFNGVLYEAWFGASGTLNVATSTNGYTYSGATSVGVSGSGSPSIAAFNGELYIAYSSGSVIHMTTSLNGHNWTPPVVVTPQYGMYPRSGGIRGRPTLYTFGNSLLMAYIAATPSGATPVIAQSLDGLSYSIVATIGLPTYRPVSDPAIVTFNGNLAAVYLQGSNGNPVVSVFSPSFTLISNAETNGITLVNDPALTTWGGSLLILGQSIYQAEDNMWGIATPDGVNFYTQHEFGVVFSGGPGAAAYNGGLSIAARSKYNSNMWGYTTQ
jgi:hypothetical protein